MERTMRLRYLVGERTFEGRRIEYWYDTLDHYIYARDAGSGNKFDGWYCSGDVWDRTFRHADYMDHTCATDEVMGRNVIQVEQYVHRQADDEYRSGLIVSKGLPA